MNTIGKNCLLSAVAASLIAFALNAMTCHGAVLIDFSSSDQGWTAAVESGSSANPFLWNASAGVGGEGAWYTAGSAVTSVLTLSSPQFQVVTDGPITLSIKHRYNFETFSPFAAIDGSQLRYRVNGGSWSLVGSSSFIVNGYQTLPVNALSGQAGWSSESSGYVTPAYITSTASFGSFATGDTLEIQFRAGWDNSIANTAPNWVIGEVSINNAVPEPSTIGLFAAFGLTGFALIRRWKSS